MSKEEIELLKLINQKSKGTCEVVAKGNTYTLSCDLSKRPTEVRKALIEMKKESDVLITGLVTDLYDLDDDYLFASTEEIPNVERNIEEKEETLAHVHQLRDTLEVMIVKLKHKKRF